MIIPNRYIQKIGSNFDWCEKKIYGADEGDDLKWKQNKQNGTKRVELVGTGSKKNCTVVKNGMIQLLVDEIPESDAN